MILDYGNHKPDRKIRAVQVDMTGTCDVRIGYALPFKDETFNVGIKHRGRQMLYQTIINWILSVGNALRIKKGLEPLTPTQAKDIYKKFHAMVTEK